ncbi:BsuBI/PstI family type II restriction endonuclease [Raoultella ornithinolytica]|uniref:site-specific DNA-methyltransferase (adenine-specific) n=1 Tax=Raoultella ornithinolytica TaxID=54291 RepID=A0A9Q9JB99_RAOOR|nr:BsuBI/PstI family type II restriction endonuclease [Raoultella ornithinolytica]MDH7611353.1 BsuBI/PstI family type II restriction endonuclease [Raoultella ornithinolytica]UXE37713.1 Eco57I restriction-modification methylase domain-containing protein [Raoultella ornithinolytica]
MRLLELAEQNRKEANKLLNPKTKSALGQFMTPAPICLFMASLFDNIESDVKLLDPGCGVGSLSAAFVDRALSLGVERLEIEAYDIEEVMLPFLDNTLKSCANEFGEKFSYKINKKDYIIETSQHIGNLFALEEVETYSHVIMNPPYKKILSSSPHRISMSNAGIETVNLYSGFVALALKQLKPGGELVAIIPRSFCNGPYYQPFREQLISETSIKHIHIFDTRNTAFAEDEVLQENIILHCVKGVSQGEVTITSSPTSDFHLDEETGQITVTDMTQRKVSIDKIVNPTDKQKFIHIAASPREQDIIERLSPFTSTLDDLKIQVSTGPVVNFRLRDDLRETLDAESVPLLFPQHLNGKVHWPLDGKKPNAIRVSDSSRPWLWKNEGYFLIIKRFSSKEEKRRIVATLYDSSLPGDLIGFENKTNVFHIKKVGMDANLARGLYVYLNCTLLDKYYRQFGGHTQINASDLRSIHYPPLEILRKMGRELDSEVLSQNQIDEIINRELDLMTEGKTTDPLKSQEKIEQSLEILRLLGMPRAQINERSALTLLALLDLHPDGCWSKIQRPMIGVTPIMDWCRDVYGKEYAPNTRETFRRQTLHQFCDGGIALYNPDEPNRAVNSPKACYQIAPELHTVLLTYGTPEWDEALKEHMGSISTLVEQYAMARKMEMIPLKLNDGTDLILSPGAHSQLIKDIIVEFGPRFAPEAEVIYIGDTGAKEDHFRKERLAELGVTVNRKGKLPDVVLYWEERNWLLLIESVTSHGPVDGKRHGELAKLFANAKPGLVYVTAFPDRKVMAKYLMDLSWETEVWVADAPTHMIHLNGDRFLGPHM